MRRYLRYHKNEFCALRLSLHHDLCHATSCIVQQSLTRWVLANERSDRGGSLRGELLDSLLVLQRLLGMALPPGINFLSADSELLPL